MQSDPATAWWSVRSTEVGTQRCEGGNKRPVPGRKLPLWPLQEPLSDTDPVSENGEALWEEWRIPPDSRAGMA